MNCRDGFNSMENKYIFDIPRSDIATHNLKPFRKLDSQEITSYYLNI